MKMIDSSSSSCFGDDKFFPPGFRFHPTDEELVLYYLKRKIRRRRLKPDIIGETDVYKWDPEDLPGQSKLKTGDRQWFFFSLRDRKYPNGARSSRATTQGYWKVTGKDRNITYSSRSVGVKKTLVFYRGRAPTGERTDWVMHEYTLDEEELKRCQNVQDYYALYKVYKKSGPGPKNGEQYGAPFREEDWADDDCLDENGLFEKENSVKLVVDVAFADNTRANSQQQLPVNDLEEFMNRVVDDSMPFEPFNAAHALDQLADEGETLSAFIDNSSRDMNVLDQSIVLDASSHQYNVQGGYDLTQSATTQLCLYDVDAPEVTSGPNIPQQQPQVAEEDIFKDFLEMDDLFGPEFTAENFSNAAEKFNNLVDNLQFDETDVFSELDFFQDAASFGCDMVQCGPEQSSQPYMNNPESVMDNQFLQPYSNNIEDEAVNYQQLHTDDVNQINSQPWRHDQRFNVFSSARTNEVTVSPPPSGVVINSNSGNLSTGLRQNHSGNQEDGSSTWFSSALWSLVESIPTTPASASENVLVNRAFERMSSFSRVRINSRNTNFAAGNSTVTSRSSGRYKMGFFCFSVLGVVFALLWLLIGTSVSVLGRNISL